MSLAVTSSKTSTATVLAVSPNPVKAGRKVTLTATVTGSSPTGTVTFKDGTATLAQKALSSGRATYSLSSLKRGSHGLTASYGGDARNTPSVSGAVSLTVQ